MFLVILTLAQPEVTQPPETLLSRGQEITVLLLTELILQAEILKPETLMFLITLPEIR